MAKATRNEAQKNRLGVSTSTWPARSNSFHQFHRGPSVGSSNGLTCRSIVSALASSCSAQLRKTSATSRHFASVKTAALVERQGSFGIPYFGDIPSSFQVDNFVCLILNSMWE